jgi:peptidyl-dipeptidase Dcp
MKWHELTSAEGLDPMAFEAQACAEMGLIDEIIPRYRSTYFAHIFSGGYSAGYYSYLWAEVLDKDAFELFMQKGIFDKETAMSFRRNVLEMGGSDEPMDLYRRFRGADPDAGALLRGRGL